MKQIVILGAGFAGLQLARHLTSDNYEVTIIDQYNFHQFQPLFYQVATARLDPAAISFPLRKVFQGRKNVHIRIAKVENIDTQYQNVVTDMGIYRYDYLVIATGCSTNYFGNKNIEQHAFGMKSTPDAVTLKNRILMNFEEALVSAPEEQEEVMNIVVTGGGPTGVELAGALAEMKKYVLPKDYPDMDFRSLNIYLAEGAHGTLVNMSEASQRKSQEYLQELGVNLLFNAVVQDYDGHTVTFKDGKTIRSRTMIWIAGVMGNVPAGIPKDMLVRGNRIKVDTFNRIEGLTNAYAIGDVAYMETTNYPKGHPQLANVAINQAKNLGNNFDKLAKGSQMTEFKYKNPGTMATVGKRKAVVDLPGFSFQGRLAWLTWMFLHLMLILSVKNKLIIFINWAISYFTNDTTLRLILLPTLKETEMAVNHYELDRKDTHEHIA